MIRDCGRAYELVTRFPRIRDRQNGVTFSVLSFRLVIVVLMFGYTVEKLMALDGSWLSERGRASPGRSVLNRVCIWLCFISCAARCQDADLRVDVTLVRIPFVAEDAKGRRIRDIRREELTVTDNDVLEPIKYLWTELDRPLTIAFLIDISSSEMGFVRLNRDAVTRFVSQVLGPSDKSLVATVDEQPRLVTDLTSSQATVRDSLDMLARQRHAGELFGDLCQPPARSRRRAPGGCVETAIWDGVFHVVRSKLVRQDGRKAVLLLSDGLDLDSSVHGLSSATEAAQSAGVTVYTIKHLNPAYLALSPITAAHASKDHGMQEIALQTGGLEFTNPKHLDSVYAEIEEDLRSQYILAYPLSAEAAATPKWHRLKLGTTRQGAKIRAQAGFLAP